MKPTLQLRIGQQLTMTPQLQQAIRLLQLPTLELQAQIQQALETNVMLEAEEEIDPTTSLEALTENDRNVNEATDADELFSLAHECGTRLTSVIEVRSSLEDVFMSGLERGNGA